MSNLSIDLPAIRRVAYAFRYLPVGVDHEDLVQWGVIGLLEAMQRYDPARDAKFTTFARQRIYGAMIDGLRPYRRRSRSTCHGADARRLAICQQEVSRWSYCAPVPRDAMSAKEQAGLVHQYVEELRPTQADILRLVYWDGLSLTHAGACCGINVAAAGRRRERAIRELRGAVND